MTHKFFRFPRSVEDCVGDLEASAEWARLGYGSEVDLPSVVASGLIYIDSRACGFKNPDIRK